MALDNCVNGNVGGVGLRGILNRVLRESKTIRSCCESLCDVTGVLESGAAATNIGATERVVVEEYRGENPQVLAMARYFSDHSMFDDVVCAAVHGSLASCDEIPYSDFDAFVIVRNETLRDATRLARFSALAARARVIMHRQDPLQHHGWFVIPEFMLECYPDSFLPVVTLAESASIGDRKHLELRPEYGVDGFQRLASITKFDIQSGRFLRNLYSLKGCLSKFMLLPAVFIQSHRGRGVTKRDSFEQVRELLGENSKVMDHVSKVRLTWVTPRNFLLRTVANSALLGRTVGSKRVAPRVSADLRARFDGRVQAAMVGYIEKMFCVLKSKDEALAS